MNTRAFALACALAASACSHPTPAPLVPAASSAQPAALSAPLLPYVTLLTHGAKETDSVQLVVALHGLGDTPENFVSLYRDLPIPARVVALRAPTATGSGFQWFPRGNVESPAFKSSFDSIAATIQSLRPKHPACAHVIITGFSQGAILTDALITATPAYGSTAVPISGYLPKSMWPEPRGIGGLPAHIVAFHGDADSVLSVADDRATIEAMQKAFFLAELRTYPNVGHEITPAMQKDIVDTIATMSKELGCTPR